MIKSAKANKVVAFSPKGLIEARFCLEGWPFRRTVVKGFAHFTFKYKAQVSQLLFVFGCQGGIDRLTTTASRISLGKVRFIHVRQPIA